VENDQPAAEHRKHFPDCPFVAGKSVGNVPVVTSEILVAPLQPPPTSTPASAAAAVGKRDEKVEEKELTKTTGIGSDNRQSACSSSDLKQKNKRFGEDNERGIAAATSLDCNSG
jgi:hypothetical protein